ncbi:MAG: CocE/NonD family hydrolase [Sedimentisphaerales bacterium]|jgi:putative CocE/NonD family hydrolase
MKSHSGKVSRALVVLGIAGIVWPAGLAARQDVKQRVSEPGQYEGYSEPVYDGWRRDSLYVTVRDGTKIAMDIFRPTRRGKLHSEPLPVIWEHRRYQRASQDKDGRIFSQLDRQDHPMRKVVLYGYVYAVAAVRGSGASFGTRIDPTPPQESLDAYDITEWLAARPWCTGKVGMYGISYSGTDQFMAASAAPPHLKAIFPEMAMLDLYDMVYPGGIFRHTFMRHWAQEVRELDLYLARKPAPVEGASDKDLQETLAQHKDNFDVDKAASAPYRDSVIEGAGAVWRDHSPSSYIDQVNRSGVAVYQRAGWFDMYPRDMLIWFNNLKVPKKIVIGPWNHYQSNGLDRATEMLRWYDYWLKGIDNGIMDEPPILYGVIGLPRDKSVRWSNQWPPAPSHPVAYYFCDGASHSVDSVNDGRLSTAASAPGTDRYKVDYTTTSGPRSRWAGGPPAYPDMTANDRKALTYTTAALTDDIEIAGHPIVHLWIECSADDDVDLFAYLEEVEPDGRSTYITDGCLRASHRRLNTPDHHRMGLPYHRGFAQDKKSLPDKPVELIFDLYPTANLFEAGHRIRLSITCADRDNNQTPRIDPAPEVTVYRTPERPSRIVLPIYKAQ